MALVNGLESCVICEREIDVRNPANAECLTQFGKRVYFCGRDRQFHMVLPYYTFIRNGGPQPAQGA